MADPRSPKKESVGTENTNKDEIKGKDDLTLDFNFDALPKITTDLEESKKLVQTVLPADDARFDEKLLGEDSKKPKSKEHNKQRIKPDSLFLKPKNKEKKEEDKEKRKSWSFGSGKK